MRVQVIKLDENATIPTKGSRYSAGYDIYAANSVIIPARKWALVKTGVAIFWDDETYYAQICPRSGLSLKNGISPRAGVIDYDYRKAIGVILMNESDVDYNVACGDRIAQFIFKKIDVSIEFEEVTQFEELETDRNGGFGSTGA